MVIGEPPQPLSYGFTVGEHETHICQRMRGTSTRSYVDRAVVAPDEYQPAFEPGSMLVLTARTTARVRWLFDFQTRMRAD